VWAGYFARHHVAIVRLMYHDSFDLGMYHCSALFPRFKPHQEPKEPGELGDLAELLIYAESYPRETWVCRKSSGTLLYYVVNLYSEGVKERT